MAPKKNSGNYQISATPITMLAHLLVLAIATLVLVWVLRLREGIAFRSHYKVKILNTHTLLMVIGFILASGEAIMAYKSIPAKRKIQKGFHFTLNLIALLAGIIGVYAAFKFKHEVNSRDMVTLHSWLGMITICLFGLQWLFGFVMFLFPKPETSRRASYKPWHVFGGIVIFLLAICTAETGLVQRSMGLGLNDEGYVINFTGLALFLFAVAVGLSALLPGGY